jgi:hypothetical protein
MAIKAADALRNGALDQMETVGGSSPILRIYSGSEPATIATAFTGSVLAQGVLPPDWLANAASGAKGLAGLWSLTGQSGAGGGTNAGYYRIINSGDSLTLFQGLAGGTVQIPTTAITAAMGNVLTFSSTTGVVVGMRVSGTGVLADTFVVAVSGTTATLSRTSTAGVSSGASITFNYDLTLDNASIADGQTVTVQSWTLTMGGG